MKNAAMVFAACMLTSCGWNVMEYKAHPIDPARVPKIVEQVLFEQPAKFRPEAVEVTPEYIDIGGGELSLSRHRGVGVEIVPGVIAAGGRSRTTSKQMITRLYYNSLGEPQLYTRGHNYFVEVRDSDHYHLMRVYSHNLDRATEFADALTTLKASAAPR